MKILVTGGLGFIGSNFIRYVLKSKPDMEIINIDALKYGANENNLRDIQDRYTFVRGDISNLKLVSTIIPKVNVVVNFAAETHVDRSISSPKSFIESNIIGVFTLLEAVRKLKPEVRFIHISTDEVYGDILNGRFTENDPLKPSSPYSASKASADMLVLSYTRTYDIDAIITRCTNNYGSYQFPEKLIPKTIIRSSMNLKVPVYGSGKNVRDWIYVLDHCAAIEAVMEHGKKGRIYNISSNIEKTTLEIVRKILNSMGKREELIEFVEDRPGHDFRYGLDSTEIRKLGWKTRYSFDDRLKETVRWYLSNKWWWKPLISEKILHPTPWNLKW